MLSEVFEIELWCNGSTTDFDSVCLGSNPGSSTNMFFETTICYFICEVIVGGWLASVGLEQGKLASTCRPRDAGSR